MVRQFVFALTLVLPMAAQAQTAAQGLSRCLADSTSGKDRKDLARWVFLAMAAHPEIKRYTSAEATAAADDTNKAMANLFTRLLVNDCPKEAQAAIKDGGPTVLQGAFGSLGELAMQELMSNSDVKTDMAAFTKYIDQQKINQVLTPK